VCENNEIILMNINDNNINDININVCNNDKMILMILLMCNVIIYY